MMTSSAFMAVLFLGGWELFPFSERTGWAWVHWLNYSPDVIAALLRFGVVGGKIFAFIVFFMWVRWTLPRFRFDQLMRLTWRGMVPIGLGLVALATILVYSGHPATAWATAGNVVIAAIALAWMAIRKAPVTGRQAHMPVMGQK
jgi:NADH-quinone oxidoreductase subunit H